MNRNKPLPADVIRGISAKIEVLLKNGIIAKDFVINTTEASIITGLSPETIRQYGKTGYISTIHYPGKNLYPCKEICAFVLSRYQERTLPDTTQINGSRLKTSAAKRGRPLKKAVGRSQNPPLTGGKR